MKMAAVTEIKQNVRDCKISNIVRKEQGYLFLMFCTRFVIFCGNVNINLQNLDCGLYL
jgi:hypothetical protein